MITVKLETKEQTGNILRYSMKLMETKQVHKLH